MYMTDHARLTEAAELLAELEGSIHDAEQTIENLRTLGVIHAGVWWKDGKYLYVIHPSDGFGYRNRQYIGADPIKVQTTLAAIERAKEYDATKRRLSDLRAKLDRFRRLMDQVRYALE